MMKNIRNITILPKSRTINHVFHLSDVHIRNGNKTQCRYEEYLESLVNLEKKFLEFDTTVIDSAVCVITGDIFHNKGKIESGGVDLFYKLINGIATILPVYLIQGNHDYRQDETNELDMISAFFDNNIMKNVLYMKETGIYIAGDVAFGLVAISDVLQKGDTSGHVDILPEFPAYFPKNIKHKIALFHGTISNCTLQNFSTSSSGYPIEWFKAYDFGLFGDVHLKQLHKNDRLNILWGYPGSLIQQNFGESVANHGLFQWIIRETNVLFHEIYNTYFMLTIRLDKNVTDWIIVNHNNMLLSDFIHQLNQCSTIRIKISSLYTSNDIIDLNTLLQHHNYDIIYDLNNKLQNSTYCATSSSFISTEISNGDILSIYNQQDTLIRYISEHGNPDILNMEDVNTTWMDMFNCPDTFFKIQFENNHIPRSLHDRILDKNKVISKSIEQVEVELDSLKPKKNILFLRNINWNWILCYGKNNNFNFESTKHHSTLISGMNGVGKSSFYEIICVALFGQAIPSRTNQSKSGDIICTQKPSSEKANTTVYFSLNNCNYKLYREFRYQADGVRLHKLSVKLFIQKEGNSNTGSEVNYTPLKSGACVEHWINQNIGKIDAFLLSSMISQSYDQDFFNKKSNEQFDILDKALNITSINNIIQMYKQIVLSLSNVIDNYELIHTKTLEDVKQYESFSDKELHSLQNEHTTNDQSLKVSQNLLNQFTITFNDVFDKHTDIELDNLIKSFQDKYSSTKEKINVYYYQHDNDNDNSDDKYVYFNEHWKKHSKYLETIKSSHQLKYNETLSYIETHYINILTDDELYKKFNYHSTELNELEQKNYMIKDYVGDNIDDKLSSEYFQIRDIDEKYNTIRQQYDSYIHKVDDKEHELQDVNNQLDNLMLDMSDTNSIFQYINVNQFDVSKITKDIDNWFKNYNSFMSVNNYESIQHEFDTLTKDETFHELMTKEEITIMKNCIHQEKLNDEHPHLCLMPIDAFNDYNDNVINHYKDIHKKTLDLDNEIEVISSQLHDITVNYNNIEEDLKSKFYNDVTNLKFNDFEYNTFCISELETFHKFSKDYKRKCVLKETYTKYLTELADYEEQLKNIDIHLDTFKKYNSLSTNYNEQCECCLERKHVYKTYITKCDDSRRDIQQKKTVRIGQSKNKYEKYVQKLKDNEEWFKKYYEIQEKKNHYKSYIKNYKLDSKVLEDFQTLKNHEIDKKNTITKVTENLHEKQKQIKYLNNEKMKCESQYNIIQTISKLRSKWIKKENELDKYLQYNEIITLKNQYNSYDNDFAYWTSLNKLIVNLTYLHNRKCIIATDLQLLKNEMDCTHTEMMRICELYDNKQKIHMYIENHENITHHKICIAILENKFLSDIIEYKNTRSSLDYWRNVKINKKIYREKTELIDTISLLHNRNKEIYSKIELYNQSIDHRNTILSEIKTNEYNINSLKNRKNIITHVNALINDYRSWLYHTKIIKHLLKETNDIVNIVNPSRDLALKADINISNKQVHSFNWSITNGPNTVCFEKASGFQKFIIGLAMRIALSNIGATTTFCKQLFIDEGFSSCDTNNLNKIPLFIEQLLSIYDSVILVSHIDEIKDSCNLIVNIQQKNNDKISTLNFT